MAEETLFDSVTSETDKLYVELAVKVEHLEKKLNRLQNKEDILEEFIVKAQDQLNTTDTHNYKLRGQLQSIIARHISLLNELTDAIVKLEKLIQDYRKMQIDINNSKIMNYAKWKSVSKENADEKRLLEIIKQFEQDFNSLKNLSISDLQSEQAELIKSPATLSDTILKQTFDEGYKL